MKTTVVKFSKSYAIVANYNKVTFEVGAEAEVEKGETAEDAYTKLKEVVAAQLNEQLETAAEELKALK